MGKILKEKKEKTVLPSSEKCGRVWEKARRDRMKVLFDELSRLLPKHDPSMEPPSRPIIIQKAMEHIRELQAQNEELLSGGFDEVYKTKLETWKKRVKDLLCRVEQLSGILRTADIHVPPLTVESGCQWTTTRPKHWSHKFRIPDDQMEEVIKNLAQKTRKAKYPVTTKGKKRKTQSKENQPNTLLTNDLNNRKILLDRSKSKNISRTVKKKVTLKQSSKPCKKSTNDTIKHTVSSATIAFTGDLTKTAQTPAIDYPKNGPVTSIGISKGLPLVMPQTCPPTVAQATTQIPNPSFPSIIQTTPQAGTFILTNQGNLVPVIAPSVLTPVIINRPPPLLVVRAAPQSVPLHMVMPRSPPNKKRIGRESTVMTFANKRPIPALSKQSHPRKGGKCVAHKNINHSGTGSTIPPVARSLPAISPTATFLNSFPVVTTPKILEREEEVPSTGPHSTIQDNPENGPKPVEVEKTACLKDPVGNTTETELVFTIDINKTSSVERALATTKASSTVSLPSQRASVQITNPLNGEIVSTPDNTGQSLEQELKAGNHVASTSLIQVSDCTTLLPSSDEPVSASTLQVSSPSQKEYPEMCKPSLPGMDAVSSASNGKESVPTSIERRSSKDVDVKLKDKLTDVPKVTQAQLPNSIDPKSDQGTMDKISSVTTRQPGPLPCASLAPFCEQGKSKPISQNASPGNSIKETKEEAYTRTTSTSTIDSAVLIKTSPAKPSDEVPKIVTSVAPTTSMVSNPNSTTSSSLNTQCSQSSWLPLPPMYSTPTSSWRGMTSEPSWTGSSPPFADPWGIPHQGYNQNTPSSLQFSNASTFGLYGNAQPVFSDPWSSAQAGTLLSDSVPNSKQSIMERKPSVDKFSTVGDNKFNSPAPTQQAYTSKNNSVPVSFISSLSQSQPVSSASNGNKSVYYSSTLPNLMTTSNNYPSGRSDSLYVPSLSEPWCVPSSRNANNVASVSSNSVNYHPDPTSNTIASNISLMPKSTFTSSTIQEPWKTPSFAQNKNSPSTSCCVAGVVTGCGSTYTYTSSGLNPCNQALTFTSSSSAITASKGPVSPTETRKTSSGLGITAVPEPWRAHSSFVQDIPLSTIPAQVQVLASPWKGPMTINKSSESSAPFSSSFLSAPPPNLPLSARTKSDSIVQSSQHSANTHRLRKATTTPNVTVSQHLPAETWTNLPLDAFHTAFPQYPSDDTRPNAKQTISYPCENFNEAIHTSINSSRVGRMQNNIPSMNSTHKISLDPGPAKIPSSGNFAISQNLGLVSATISAPSSLHTPHSSSYHDKPDRSTKLDAGKTHYTELHPLSTSQTADGTFFQNAYQFVPSSIAPLTTPFPPPVPATNTLQINSPTTSSLQSQQKRNLKVEKKETAILSGQSNYNKTKMELAGKATPQTFENGSGARHGIRHDSVNKNEFADSSNILWNTQYFPPTSVQGPNAQPESLPWSQVDYICGLEMKERPKPPVNWMTETDQRADTLCQPEDPFQSRYHNVFDRKEHNILDFLNNPLEESGKVRKKDEVIAQDYFGWVSMKSDPLVVPSTLPTLVGDLALGSEPISAKRIKIHSENFSSSTEKAAPGVNHLLQEPFTNLSKNIFDTSQGEVPKDGCITETIVLKNIFELPATPQTKPKLNAGQNTFLSVSQLVEPHGSDVPQQKNTHNYSFYTQQPGKAKQGEWKCAEKKCQPTKPCSNYSAEALLRSNETLTAEQGFGFQPDSSDYTMEYSAAMEGHDGVTKSVESASNGSRQRQDEYYRGQELKSSASTGPVKNRSTKKIDSERFALPVVSLSNQHLPSFNSSTASYPKIPCGSAPFPSPSPLAYADTSTIIGPPSVPYPPNNLARKYYSKTNVSLYPFSTDPNQKFISTQSHLHVSGTSSVAGTLYNYQQPPLPPHGIPYPSKSEKPACLIAPPLSCFPPTSLPSNNSTLHHSKSLQQAQSNSRVLGQAHASKHSKQAAAMPSSSALSLGCSYSSKSVPKQQINPILTSMPMANPIPPFPPLAPHSAGTTGSSLANFNLTTIFPEMNKKGYQYT